MSTLAPTAIIYADNHLLVVDKPAGLLTQPVPDDSRDSLEEQAKAYLKAVYNKPGRVFLQPVHRIDRQVSGLVIFARTDKALSRLNLAMRDKSISKRYRAIVEGDIPGKANETVLLTHHLAHRSHHAEVSDRPGRGSRPATLSYTVLARTSQLSLVEIDLDTGRYHQIRAQLAHIGYPIFGDRRYGAQRDVPRQEGDAIALHSARLRFLHPVQKQELDLVAPYPAFWQQWGAGLI